MFFFLFLHGLDLPGKHLPHGFIEHFLESFTSEGATLDVLTVHLLFDHFFGISFLDRGLLGALVDGFKLFPLVDLVADEHLGGICNNSLQLRIPLNIASITFLTALVKLAGYTTENTIRKTSQLG